jgi:hypothetical protein
VHFHNGFHSLRCIYSLDSVFSQQCYDRANRAASAGNSPVLLASTQHDGSRYRGSEFSKADRRFFTTNASSSSQADLMPS